MRPGKKGLLLARFEEGLKLLLIAVELGIKELNIQLINGIKPRFTKE